MRWSQEFKCFGKETLNFGGNSRNTKVANYVEKISMAKGTELFNNKPVETKEPLRDKIIIAVLQTLVFAAMLCVLKFWLDLRLEEYKNNLVNASEELKLFSQLNKPLVEARYSVCLEIRRDVCEASLVLERYYYHAKEPQAHEVLRNKLCSLEKNMKIDSGNGSSSWPPSKGEAISAIYKIVYIKEKYENDIFLSGTIRSKIDHFLETAMEDLGKAEQKENDTESFHAYARKRIRDESSQLVSAIDQTLQIDKLPIK